MRLPTRLRFIVKCFISAYEYACNSLYGPLLSSGLSVKPGEGLEYNLHRCSNVDFADILFGFTFSITISIVACGSNNKTLEPSYEYRGICRNIICNKDVSTLKKLRNCTVVVGYLQIVLMETTTKDDFANISFPELREVTGHMILYRVFGLESVGSLFPNLARVRGSDLLQNYALIIFDLPNLLEIGLHSLLKVDRGGVIVWGGVFTCYMDTVNWDLITNGRRVVFPADTYSHCYVYSSCGCSLNPNTNFCWNNKKCQRFLRGPDAENCDSQCYGCTKSKATNCTLCRQYTHKGKCLSACPNGTIVIPSNKYCILESECKILGGWSWNNSCVFKCPYNYVISNTTEGITCKWCDTCEKTCNSVLIQTMANIQAAEKCVYINGSLTIHIRSILPEAIDEMRHYLSVIQEVSDYILIYSSISITSLDFLSSLQRIKGNNLHSGKYSLFVFGMQNLQSLFTEKVTKNLKIDNGTLRFYNNPVLCLSKIEELKEKFPNEPAENDIPQFMNGYSGACDELSLQLRVEVKNETFAEVIFNRKLDKDIQYSILYVRVPQGTHATFVPETCSESEWDAINVPSSKLKNRTVYIDIPTLRPASSYALCIETYKPKSLLARSSIVNFNTSIGKPEPPFITELVASTSESVVVRWVDHKDYRLHIIRYELDISIVEISSKDVAVRDHCFPVVEDPQELEYSRHAIVMRAPKNYEKGCESMCGILSTVPAGALTEDYFDVCSSLRSGCDEDNVSARMTNSTFGKYVRTLSLNISGPTTDFQVGNLAPFRDYRFQLRACTINKCSRSMSGVVRTLRFNDVDAPHVQSVKANESGIIHVQWKPPKVTNGPILSYHVEILPILPEMEKIMPRIWCVPSDVTNMIVNFDASTKYVIKICATTLGTNYICSNSVKLKVTTDASTLWWMGFPCAIILYIVSLFIGWRAMSCKNSDEISLVDMMSTYRNESEPPSQMLPDFVQLYTIPLRESQID